ncbi:MAG: hypothetical protein OXU79_01155 [Gemmatimonadota bacterium]|nr:hypothetical protein [Gemmatimonadota bacterium]
MSRKIRNVFVSTVAAGLLSGCGGDRVATSMAPEADRRAEEANADTGHRNSGQQSGKLATGGNYGPAVVAVTVLLDGAPQGGVTVELSRSVSGRTADFAWSGTTNAQGEARIALGSANVNGYYRARVVQDGTVIGSWSSIPVNGGYAVSVELQVGGGARVTGTLSLSSLEIVGSWGYVGTDMVDTISRNLVATILEQGLVDSTVAVAIVREFTGEMETSLRDSVWSPVRRFHADGTFEDQDSTGAWSVTGTWSAIGNSLTIIEVDGVVLEGSVDVDGDRLTLTLTREQYMRIVLQAAGELNEEDREFFDAMLREDDVIRFFFEAR